MLSILIPIYKWDTTTLINSLVKQGNSINVPYEIIAIDDFSNSEHDKANFSMNQYDFVNVYRNTENLGRSKTRNLLASRAKYRWLLFLDCDSYIEDNFLVNYVKEINNSEADVICGGTSYSPLMPTNKNYLLHWKYGTKREVKSVEERSKSGFKSFASNNFVINALVFSTIQFDESIKEYGHEDTLLGKQLEQAEYRIKHIENRARHLGLNSNEVFIKNAEKAIENLVILFRQGKLSAEDVKLLTQHIKRKSIVNMFGKYTKNFAYNRALNNSCLYCFDLYRLILLTEKLVG